MNEIRMFFWAVLVLMTIIPIFTALNDGSFYRDEQRGLKFSMSYHYEALYGDIFIINAANYLVLEVMPTLSVFYHAGIYAACLVSSCYWHKSWAPLSGEKPQSHFFKKTHFATAQYPLAKKVGWWKSFSAAGWLHLFFLPAALTLAIEYIFLARRLPVRTVVNIGFVYFIWCVFAVIGYQTAISRGLLEVDSDKIKELALRLAAVITISIIKWW